MTRSLRRTLAVRFAATMAVGLIAASAAVFWGAARVLEQQLDQGLSAASFIALDRLVNLPACCEREPPLAAEPVGYARLVNRYLALRDPDGHLLHAMPHFAADLPFDTAAFRSARSGKRTFVTGTWRGGSVRSLYRPVERAGVTGEGVLQVSASLEPIRLVQRQLVLALAFVVLLGTGATLIGAWQLSGSAVRPVVEITDQAMRIQAGTLDQRIAAHATDDEYRGLVTVLNGMLQRLDRAFRNQRRLTADVSHELRSPLTALQGEIEVALRAERSPREYQRVLRSALEEIERLSAMSEDLLLITRAEARLLEPNRTPTDVGDLVRRSIESLRGRIEEKRLTVDVAFDGRIWPVPLDPGLVARLVGHLVENAIKFAPVEGRVRIATQAFEGGIRFAVEDSGSGFPPADLAHVFEPFYRADQARSRGTGTGLGLALVAAIARLHGGAARAANLPGGGARVEVDFPTPHPTSPHPTFPQPH
ncbi:MAG: HAMP domain-containing protein [Gemmatimonadetes bacterium]|nr:HAMP domain-containing protein [Gemmatimonadota bacterium]